MTVTQLSVNNVLVCNSLHVGVLRNFETQRIYKTYFVKLYGKNPEFVTCPEINREPILKASLTPPPAPSDPSCAC